MSDSLGAVTPLMPELSAEERATLIKERFVERLAANPVGHIDGRVTGLNGEPLAGVKVKVDQMETTTDASGAYSLPNVRRGIYVVSFEHPDYVFTQRQATLLPGQDPWVDTPLLKRGQVQRFNVDKGAVIQEGPLTLSFEPQDLIFADGSPVHGEVDIVVTAIDPRRPGHISASPARLEGIDAGGAQVGLVSYGMLEVEIVQGTRKVQVRPGETVQTSVEIGENAGLKPGDTIPLWHHDTSIGVWVQERGTNALVREVGDGLLAQTELPHFSAWNFDRVVDATCSKFSVVINSSAGKSLMKLRVYSTDASGVRDSVWEILSDCTSQAAGNSARRYTCITNVPAAGFGQFVYFALDAQVKVDATGVTSWVPLDRAGLAASNSRVEKAFWQGSDVRDWVQASYPSASPWCGTPPPIGYLKGTHDLVPPSGSSRALLFTLPSSTWDPNVGTTNLAKFQAMRMNVAPDSVRAAAGLPAEPTPYSYDSDRDSVSDNVDNCQNVSNPSQDDGDQNGVGDACEVWCFVPPGPDAALDDTDGDGIDDLCDNNWMEENEDQYIPLY